MQLADEAAVRALEPDLRRLRAVDARGVIVTAAGDAVGASRPRPRAAGAWARARPTAVAQLNFYNVLSAQGFASTA